MIVSVFCLSMSPTSMLPTLTINTMQQCISKLHHYKYLEYPTGTRVAFALSDRLSIGNPFGRGLRPYMTWTRCSTRTVASNSSPPWDGAWPRGCNSGHLPAPIWHGSVTKGWLLYWHTDILRYYIQVTATFSYAMYYILILSIMPVFHIEAWPNDGCTYYNNNTNAAVHNRH